MGTAVASFSGAHPPRSRKKARMLPNPSRRRFMQTAGLLSLAAAPLPSNNDPPLAPPDKQPPYLTLPRPARRQVGWAVVGLGQLALEEVMPAFSRCNLSRPVA